MQEITINIFNTVGNVFCVEVEDGEKVYNLIRKGLEEGKKFILSFKNVEMLTSAFLNTAVGQLYRDFDENTIKNSLKVEHISPEDRILFKRVTTTAKLYYKDPERLQNSIKEILGE